MPVKIIDSDPVDIEITDQTTSPVEWYLSRKIATSALASNIPVTDEGTYLKVSEPIDITLVDVTGAAAGLWMEIWEDFFFFQAEIVSVAGNIVTLSKPIGLPYTTNAIVYIVDVDQNKNFTAGGIGAKDYTFAPAATFKGDMHLNRMIVTMLHLKESDSSTYGGITGGIPNGIIFKGQGTLFPRETGLSKNLVLYDTLLNIKKNEDWEATAYDVAYQPKSGNPSSPTNYGTRVRKTFNGQDRSGVAIPVRKIRDEKIIITFRDDLSTLVKHRIKAMGHLTNNVEV